MRDLTREGSSNDVANAYRDLSQRLRDVELQLGRVTPRTDATVIAARICAYLAKQSDRLSEWIGGPIDQIAWATRNVFECHLRCRYYFKNGHDPLQLIAELASDEISVIEGFVTISESQHATDALLKEVRARQEKLVKHGLARTKPPTVATLASTCGLNDEYEAFYKFYSKYVHPSALLLIGVDGQIDGVGYRNILWLYSLLYLHSSLQILAERFALPGAEQ